MEARKEALRALTACRFCLRRGSLTSIYDKTRHNSPVPLPLQIMACVNIEVFPSDGMPSQICERCMFFMGQGYQFKQVCRNADETLLRFVQTAEPLAPVAWPDELLETAELFCAVDKKLATAVDDPVKVKDSPSSEDDEEDEDVFNIKIETEGGEQSEGSGLARIKVTQRGGEITITEEEDQDPDEVTEESPMKEEGSELEPSKYPCDTCERVFPLEQLLHLHQKRQHRARTIPCPHCSDMFFSKYDLAAHLPIHSNETPFQCVACGQRFKRYNLLKRHEKTRHSGLPQFPCAVCRAGFLSEEERDVHAQRHRDDDKKAHKCPMESCGAKFHSNSSMRRHLDLIHSDRKTYGCNYCNEKFSTAVRLARHIKEHAGTRPYPCKYCNKTFLKSHHFTRHLRMNHSQIASTMHTAMGVLDLYPCSECSESFTSQETLAYHEAQHAAESLTCPLCHENFADVEAVTEHVKLHADQEKQFVCEYCELVFVSEEKVDKHMLEQHSDDVEAVEDTLDGCEQKATENSSLHELPCLETIDDAEAKTANEEDAEETTYTELATVDTLRIARMQAAPAPQSSPVKTVASVQKNNVTPLSPLPKTAGILRKAEEVKRRAQQERALSEAAPKQPRVKAPAPVRKNASPEKKMDKKPADESTPLKKQVTSERKENQKECKVQEIRQDKKQERDDKQMTNKQNKVEKADKRIEKEDKMVEKEAKNLDKEEKRVERKVEQKTPREDKKQRTVDNDTDKEKRTERVEKKLEREEKKTDKDDKRTEKEKKPEREETPSEKSLRILERDLQELKRQTVSRNTDTPDKPLVRGRGRPALTPAQKLQRIKDREAGRTGRSSLGAAPAAPSSSAAAASATPARLATGSRDRRDKTTTDDKDAKEDKEKDKLQEELDAPTRRSSRSSRVKDYAKMVRDNSSSSSEVESDEEERSPRPPPQTPSTEERARRGRGRPARASTAPVKRRGRPPLQTSIKKSKKYEEETEESTESSPPTEAPVRSPVQPSVQSPVTSRVRQFGETSASPSTPNVVRTTADNIVLTPTGQTLTKVPASVIKSLPPGVKPKPLPPQLQKSVGGAKAGGICEMRMGERTVKVQKIVMTKSEVEDMYRKGLLEMKHGTMVLKNPRLAGARLPVGDMAAVRSLVRAAAAAAPAPADTAASAPDTPAAAPDQQTVSEANECAETAEQTTTDA